MDITIEVWPKRSAASERNRDGENRGWAEKIIIIIIFINIVFQLETYWISFRMKCYRQLSCCHPIKKTYLLKEKKSHCSLLHLCQEKNERRIKKKPHFMHWPFHTTNFRKTLLKSHVSPVSHDMLHQWFFRYSSFSVVIWFHVDSLALRLFSKPNWRNILEKRKTTTTTTTTTRIKQNVGSSNMISKFECACVFLWYKISW